jgi:Flp pilus assembly pilin Flp
MIAGTQRLRQAEDGTAAIEFALLAPVFFVMLFGVLQIGLWMQAHNALRGVAADVSRHVLVESQKANPMSNEQIRLYGTATAVRAPYLLASDRVTVSIVAAAEQRVTGARELRFSISYVVPGVLEIIDLPEVTVSFSRPVFVAA